MEKELSLLELSRLIKSTIEQNVGGPYWVVAEIGDLKVNQNGHCYLELVEKENNQVLAKARATIWANVYARLAPYFAQASGERLKPGLKILCQVKPGFHEVFGLSLNILSIDPKYTVGERAKRREQIIKQLTEEGLVTLNKRLTWPLVPNRIAVISSETAAGYQDFMHQLQSNRYGYSYTTTLFQAVMQGDGAVSSISMALEEIRSQANQYDVLAILRGGGSSLDLDCFDSYELAVELAHFPLPVLTGIGHDKDSTVIDIVAYQSLKTPTALAEFLIQSVMQFEELLLTRTETIRSFTNGLLQRHALKIEKLQMILQHSTEKYFNNSLVKMDHLAQKLKHVSSKVVSTLSHKLELLETTVSQNDPEKIFRKGYSFTSRDGILLKNVSDLKVGDEIVTFTARNKITSNIEQIENNPS